MKTKLISQNSNLDSNTTHAHQMELANSTSSTSQQKIISPKHHIDVFKIKYMRIGEFVQSLQLSIDLSKNISKQADSGIYFFQIIQKSEDNNKGQTRSWQIKRRYQDLVTFDRKVRSELSKREFKKQLPDLPYSKEPKNIELKYVLDFLEGYLKAMTSLETVNKTSAFWEFIELSDFTHEGIVKVKETFVRKRSGGHFQQRSCLTSCNPFNSWKRRYIAITSEGIMYSIGNRIPKAKVREMLLFDHSFEVKYGKYQTSREKGILLITTTRKLFLEAYDFFHFVDIIASLKEAFSLSPYVQLHRFDSFAPIRQNSGCNWFIDGQGYFEALYHKLIGAVSEVFITDWWLSPEMYLLRPVSKDKNQESRIDVVLKQMATKGVKIYIIVYREPTIALTLNSNYTKQQLCSLHPNIKVMRHPNTLLPMLWSHHEKMIIIDQKYGFLGGLDICYGRWDNQNHCLTDNDPDNQFFPGIDYSNSRKKDFVDVKQFQVSEINRKCDARMPWHDITMIIEGDAIKDMTRHFIQYWNFVKFDMNNKEEESLIPSEKQQGSIRSAVKGYFHRFIKKFKTIKKDPLSNSESPKKQQEQSESIGKQTNIEEKTKETSKHQQEERGEFSLFEKSENKASRFSAYFDKMKGESQEIRNSKVIPKRASSNNDIDKIVHHFKRASFQGKLAIPNPSSKLNIIRESEELEDKAEGCNQNIINLPESYKVDDSESSQDEKDTTQNIISEPTIQNEETREKRSSSVPLFLSEEKIQENDKVELYLPILEKLKANLQQSTEETNDFYIPTNRAVSHQPSHQSFFGIFKSKTIKREVRSSSNNLSSEVTKDKPKRKINVENQKEEKQIEVPFFMNSNSSSFQNSLPEMNDIKSNTSSVSENHNSNISSFPHQSLNKQRDLTIVHLRNNTAEPFSGDWKKNREDSPALSLNDSFVKPTRSQDDSLFDKCFGLQTKKESLFKMTQDDMKKRSCVCQMLRSSSKWSLGLKQKNHELSIQLAYIELIASSTNFIYIENQFFISCTAGSKVKNLIAQALIERIIRAAEKEENFKVVVVMPLLPGFEGEVNGAGSGVMKCQLHWEYYTISRGGSSILEILQSHPKINDPSKYIQFFGLRQHGMIKNTPATEIIYVHSKLMIVDDNYAIIGSANINDRSMLGTRDSEIAMIIEDTQKVETPWDEEVQKVGQFSHSLRCALFQEHFGLTYKQAQNPLSFETWGLIYSRAAQNTLIYRNVFACYPDDTVESLDQLEDFQKSKNLELYSVYQEGIVGNAVVLPLNFLKKETLSFNVSQKEYFVPDENFT